MADGMPKRVRRRMEHAFAELRWRMYGDDPYRFMADCVQVEAKPKMERLYGVPRGKGRVPLKLFEYQREALGTVMESQFTVVLKARQLGLTTIVMAYALWLLLFRPGTTIIMVSKDQETADSALSMLDFMWRFMPHDVKERAPVLENDAARHHSWRFPDGMVSRIRSYAATDTVSAGQTASLVIWDEAALARAQEDTLRTLLPLTDAGGSMIVFSTARGGSNGFANLYRDARDGRAEVPWRSIFYPWYWSRLMNSKADRVATCPDGPCDECIDRSEYAAKKATLRHKPWMFYAEYPETDDEAFRMSGRSRFTGLPPLEEFEAFPLRGRMVDGRFVLDEDGPLRCTQEFLQGVPAGATAVVSVDPSAGGGGDFLAMTAGWFDPDGIPKRVAFWHANDFEMADATVDAVEIGQHLSDGDGRPALLVVERQGGWGDTIIHELRTRHRYMNLYAHVYTGHRKMRSDTMFGFPMTAQRRPLVIDTLAKWLRFDGHPTLEGIDPLLRSELGSFVVRDDGKVAADVGAHDDLVMSTAIWLYVLQERAKPAASAMAVPKVEEDPRVQTLTVAHIFEEAERVRQKNDQREARQMRRLARRMR